MPMSMNLLVLKSTFDAFDVDRKGYIEADMVGTIMDMLGTHVLAEELDVNILTLQIFFHKI